MIPVLAAHGGGDPGVLVLVFLFVCCQSEGDLSFDGELFVTQEVSSAPLIQTTAVTGATPRSQLLQADPVLNLPGPSGDAGAVADVPPANVAVQPAAPPDVGMQQRANDTHNNSTTLPGPLYFPLVSVPSRTPTGPLTADSYNLYSDHVNRCHLCICPIMAVPGLLSLLLVLQICSRITSVSAADVTLKNVQINCTQGKIEVGVNVTELNSLSLNPSSGNLAVHNCFNHAERDGIVWYEVETKEGVCGNNLTINDTHAVYSNSLFIYNSSASFSIPVDIPFSCAYPLETDASLDVTLKPFLDMDGKISGTGDKAKAIMKLYKDKNYTATYGPGLVNLPVGSPLYVGVTVEGTPSLAAVLEDCHATYTSNPEDTGYDLIVDQCPPDKKLVSVTQSGTSLQARFTALFFLHVEDYREVYLHCSLSLCSPSCQPSCPVRAKRDVSNSELLEPVTIGPIISRQQRTARQAARQKRTARQAARQKRTARQAARQKRTARQAARQTARQRQAAGQAARQKQAAQKKRTRRESAME
ncbi:uncharacterized protein V6R79_018882 [Siganus canaliculatus]